MWFKVKFSRIRCSCDLLMPVFCDSSRTVQRAFNEGGWQATSISLSLWSWSYLGGFPERGRSFNPSIPCLAYLVRQWETATTDKFTFLDICLLFFPWAASRIVLILWTKRYCVVGLMFA